MEDRCGLLGICNWFVCCSVNDTNEVGSVRVYLIVIPCGEEGVRVPIRCHRGGPVLLVVYVTEAHETGIRDDILVWLFSEFYGFVLSSFNEIHVSSTV